MNQKIEKIKAHLKENKKVYIAVGVTFVVTAATTVLITSRVKVSQQAVNAALVNWKPSIIQEQITIIDLPARGHRGYAILNETTGQVYASLKKAAEEIGCSTSVLRDHLNGLRDNVHGEKYINLGENLSEKVKVST